MTRILVDDHPFLLSKVTLNADNGGILLNAYVLVLVGHCYARYVQVLTVGFESHVQQSCTISIDSAMLQQSPSDCRNYHQAGAFLPKKNNCPDALASAVKSMISPATYLIL